MKLSQARFVELYRVSDKEYSHKFKTKTVRIKYQKFHGKVFDTHDEIDFNWLFHEIKKGWIPYALGTNPLLNTPLEIDEEYLNRDYPNIHEELDPLGNQLSEDILKIFDKHSKKHLQEKKNDIMDKINQKYFSQTVIKLSEKYLNGESVPKLLMPEVREYLRMKNQNETERTDRNSKE